MVVLYPSGVVGPFLNSAEFFAAALSAEIVRGVRHNADVDSGFMMGLEEVL